MHKQQSPTSSQTACLHSASPGSSWGGGRLALGVHKGDGQPCQGLRLGQHCLQLLLALRPCLRRVRRVQSQVCRLHGRRARRCSPSLAQALLVACLLVPGMLQRAYKVQFRRLPQGPSTTDDSWAKCMAVKLHHKPEMQAGRALVHSMADEGEQRHVIS